MSVEPKKYRKMPIAIEAVMFPLGGQSQHEVANWVRDGGGEASLFDGNYVKLDVPTADGSFYMWKSMSIKTLEGSMRAEPGDYIIRGIKGEFYPCRGDIFAETYEATK